MKRSAVNVTSAMVQNHVAMKLCAITFVMLESIVGVDIS